MKRYLLIALLAFSLSGPVLAQEITSEVPTIAPTVEVTEVPTPPPVEIPLPDDAIFLTAGQLLAYLALAIFGGGGLMAIGYRFLETRQARDVTEKLYLGLAPDQQELIKRIVAGYEETNRRLLDFVKAIMDGKPNNGTSPTIEATVMSVLNIPWNSLDEEAQREARIKLSDVLADNAARAHMRAQGNQT